MGEEGESEPKTLFSRDSTLFCLLILLFVLFVLLVVGMVNFENSREKKEAPLVEDFMTRDGVFSHLNAFQKIAINSGDSNRETRSGGYFNSVEYVVSQVCLFLLSKTKPSFQKRRKKNITEELFKKRAHFFFLFFFFDLVTKTNQLQS